MALDDDDQWLTISEAAEVTRLSRAALAQLRYKGGGPIYYRLSGKTISYRRSQIAEWMDGCAYDRTGHQLAVR